MSNKIWEYIRDYNLDRGTFEGSIPTIIGRLSALMLEHGNGVLIQWDRDYSDEYEPRLGRYRDKTREELELEVANKKYWEDQERRRYEALKKKFEGDKA